ncbi:hypothetical protein, variant [Exophiala oligosperma]|uniref:PH domain-containing protein n=1 Tax=Exophiala oligosperma TaxID=215243 RepID=A0A0D2DG47_9EURO|nr:uncharacterized protein PV06_06952 [Exophiala oligosperma]XP_016261606.1 hypothetical protein, variant [Exophiala oligosperma]KIW41389.1 hypothetical protein PV06_06952 [Exophiala oligosperma]KIW41390.1 hypothetical protein, variant [Exophiala oligosperma]
MSAIVPTRTKTMSESDDDAIPDGDPTSTAGLLGERLQAWKHMVKYLEAYVSAVAKDQNSRAKDQEKILKTISSPLREAHHFDSALGGISSLFDNIRANTQAQTNLYIETSKSLTGSVLPILERLHQEIKNKSKELQNGAGKGSKAVEAARAASQKHIDLLGTQASHFDSSGGGASRMSAAHDPYVLKRQTLNRLNKQILDENNNRQDLIAVQNSFQQFEAHLITTVQSALNTYNQFMSTLADRQKAMIEDIAGTAAAIPLDFEWQGFAKRNQHVLVNPNAAPRSMSGVSFANDNHRATKALIEGSLERKPRGVGAIRGYTSGYYAVTPAGFLHEYKDNENFLKDPVPEVSLFLPDCVIGAVDGTKFTIKGKDSSGSKIGQKMAMSHDFQFKAHTNSDAQQWHTIIASFANSGGSVPTSPGEGQKMFPLNTAVNDQQTTGVTSATSPQSARTATSAATATTTPASAGTFHGSPASHNLEDRKYVESQADKPLSHEGLERQAGHVPASK